MIIGPIKSGNIIFSGGLFFPGLHEWSEIVNTGMIYRETHNFLVVIMSAILKLIYKT